MPEILIDTRPAIRGNLDLSQYVGLWCTEESRFLQLLDSVGRLDLAAHIAAHADADVGLVAASKHSVGSGDNAYDLAVVDIEGSLTKRGSSLSGAGSMIRLRQEIRQLANDSSVGGIMLRIDSPGGTVAGTPDLAAAVADAAQKKPVHAYVEDLAASAAYWIASQAARITANSKTAAVGSIGTYMGLYDLSGAAAREGIKAVVIKTGKHKGAGFPGSEVTEEQKALWQELVDKTQAEFTAGVASGRKLTIAQVEALADGRVYMAGDAQTHGLIDGIGSFDSAMQTLVSAADEHRSKRRGKPMSETTEPTAPRPATLAEMKAACPGADATFLMDQIERSATVAAASKSWIETLAARLEIRDEELKQAKAAAKAPGVEPLKAGGKKAAADDEEDDDEEETEGKAAFWQAVAAKEKAGVSRKAAIAHVVRTQGDAHKSMLREANRGRKVSI